MDTEESVFQHQSFGLIPAQGTDSSGYQLDSLPQTHPPHMGLGNRYDIAALPIIHHQDDDRYRGDAVFTPELHSTYPSNGSTAESNSLQSSDVVDPLTGLTFLPLDLDEVGVPINASQQDSAQLSLFLKGYQFAEGKYAKHLEEKSQQIQTLKFENEKLRSENEHLRAMHRHHIDDLVSKHHEQFQGLLSVMEILAKQQGNANYYLQASNFKGGLANSVYGDQISKQTHDQDKDSKAI